MITISILVITSIVSIVAFYKRSIMDRLLYSPRRIVKFKEYERFITYGFVHAGWMHLIFNMLVFYSFGSIMEKINPTFFMTTYLISLPLSLVYNFWKWRHSYSYTAVGASGAVSSLLYTFIIMFPMSTLSVFFIPMQAWIFGILYIGISFYMMKSGKFENIGHDVHITGALFGILFGIIGRIIL